MSSQDDGQSGYYQSIARAFLERRGAPFVLSPRDQSAIASWEARRIPLRVVLEGIGRALDRLKARGRGTKGVSLSVCEREVDAAFAQHRERTAGARGAEARSSQLSEKREKARREIETSRRELAPRDAELAGLLDAALGILAASIPDDAGLEKIDAAIEDLLWARAPAEDKAAAEADVRRELRGGRPRDIEALVRRRIVHASRAGRKVPHVSLFYY
jgi:hypothetical protein